MHSPDALMPPRPFADSGLSWTSGYGKAVWSPNEIASSPVLELQGDFFVKDLPEGIVPKAYGAIMKESPLGYRHFSLKEHGLGERNSRAVLSVALAIMEKELKPAVYIHRGKRVEFIGWK